VKDHFLSLSHSSILLKTRHKLIDVIVITLCALIAGADDWVEIAAFGREKEQWFKTFLELPKGLPSHDTFGRVFSLNRPQGIRQALCQLDSQRFPHGVPEGNCQADSRSRWRLCFFP
jgi:hypothetical protein